MHRCFWLTALLVGAGLLSCPGRHGAWADTKAPPALSPEANAARAGYALRWDIGKIREDIEQRAARIDYRGADPVSVRGIPTGADLAGLSTDALFALCRHWNPGVRSGSATELARRGQEVYQATVKKSSSADAATRVAAARILAGLMQHTRGTPPGSEQRAFLAAHLNEVLATAARLVRDPDVGVRRAALGVYEAMRPLGRDFAGHARNALPAFVQAALEQAAAESDPYICQQILIAISRDPRWTAMLNKQTRARLLGKALVNQPFPRGRGSAMRMIAALEPDEIKSILPQLLEDFRTPCLRDSMFFPGARPTSFRLIMEHAGDLPRIREEALAAASALNREPWVSLSGRHRGAMRVFWTALADAGPLARPVLPSLRELQADAEKRLADIEDKDSPSYAQAEEIVAFGRDVINKIDREKEEHQP